MRKSSTSAAAKRAGAKPSRDETKKEESTTTPPQTVPESTHKTEHTDLAPRNAPDNSKSGETDTGGSEPPATDNGDTATVTESVEEWGAAINQAAELINDLPPQLRSVVLGQTVASGAPRDEPDQVPTALSKSAKARLRHHVRAAAGRLAAALSDVTEARDAWSVEVAEVRKQGYPDAQILGQALDAGLEPDDVPANPNK